MVSKNIKSYFVQRLNDWAAANKRPLPWKNEPDPYLIWLSEIILQQTRVAQGMPYYEAFKAHFPNVQVLAAAPEDEIMRLWQGLGYYSRARNLHQTAKTIAIQYQGKFPDTYEEIRALKGVGPYTAAAIASFAFGLPYAVVDGNVSRVLSRFLGIDTPIDSTIGKKLFQDLADTLLDRNDPGKYNQQLMDFGAVHCTPQQPLCPQCPLQSECIAFRQKKTAQLPVKNKKITKTKRYFHYLVPKFDSQTLIRKRTQQDIWKHLYEFPLIETEQANLDIHDLLAQNHTTLDWWKPEQLIEIRQIGPHKQQLTHQTIIATFWELELQQIEQNQLPDQFVCINWKNLDKFAFPRIIDWYLKDNSLNLFSQVQQN